VLLLWLQLLHQAMSDFVKNQVGLSVPETNVQSLRLLLGDAAAASGA
jgi:hypothetical protein